MSTSPNLSEIARTLAAQRRCVEGTCASCGQPISGIKMKRYCSNACRQRAAYLRRTSKLVPEATQEDQP